MRLLIVWLFAAVAFAQPPKGFFPWWDAPIARDLNLSKPQMRQIRTTVRDYRTRLLDLRTALEKAETELQESLNADPFDQRRAETAVDNLSNARGNLTRAFAQMSVRLRSVLTTAQWKELEKRKDENIQRRRNRKANSTESPEN